MWHTRDRHETTAREDSAMIHLHYFITRRQGLDDDRFYRYWRETHAPIVTRIRRLKGYVQSHRIPFHMNNTGYDGAAEVWLEDLDALEDLRASAEFREGALKDEPNFIDHTRSDFMVARDHVIIDGPRAPGLVKAVWRMRRKEGVSLGEFHWLGAHAEAARKIPGVRRYVQSHTIDEAYSYGEPRWDGVAQLWWDSPEALADALRTPQFAEDLRDGEDFIDGSSISFLLAREHVIIPSP
jgi:uncharacterized protein (TIGR02118 family)